MERLTAQRKIIIEQIDECRNHLDQYPNSSQANMAYYIGRREQIDFEISLLKGEQPEEPIKPLFDLKVEMKIELPVDIIPAKGQKTGKECFFCCDELAGDDFTCTECQYTPPF